MRFLAGGCSCKLLDDTPCSSQFSTSMLQRARDECRQLTREPLEMVVMDGLCPRGRAKVLPHNTTKLSDIKNVVRYILHCAEDHTVLLPGRIPGYKRDDLQLLPSSTTKREVWQLYHSTASAGADMKAVGYSLFCTLWKELTPQVVVALPMSDLYWVCQKNSNIIVRAHNRPVEEKSEVRKSSIICMCVHVHSFNIITSTFFLNCYRHYTRQRNICFL